MVKCRARAGGAHRRSSSLRKAEKPAATRAFGEFFVEDFGCPRRSGVRSSFRTPRSTRAAAFDAPIGTPARSPPDPGK